MYKIACALGATMDFLVTGEEEYGRHNEIISLLNNFTETENKQIQYFVIDKMITVFELNRWRGGIIN